MSDKTLAKAAIKEKYAAERAKRLRSDGNEQYVRHEGEFENYAKDQHLPVCARSPVKDSKPSTLGCAPKVFRCVL